MSLTAQQIRDIGLSRCLEARDAYDRPDDLAEGIAGREPSEGPDPADWEYLRAQLSTGQLVEGYVIPEWAATQFAHGWDLGLER